MEQLGPTLQTIPPNSEGALHGEHSAVDCKEQCKEEREKSLEETLGPIRISKWNCCVR